MGSGQRLTARPLLGLSHKNNHGSRGKSHLVSDHLRFGIRKERESYLAITPAALSRPDCPGVEILSWAFTKRVSAAQSFCHIKGWWGSTLYDTYTSSHTKKWTFKKTSVFSIQYSNYHRGLPTGNATSDLHQSIKHTGRCSHVWGGSCFMLHCMVVTCKQNWIKFIQCSINMNLLFTRSDEKGPLNCCHHDPTPDKREKNNSFPYPNP